MKLKDIASKHGWDVDDITAFLKADGCYIEEKLFGAEVQDADAPVIEERYREYFNKKQAEQIEFQNRQKAAELEKQSALASILITSGFSFEGYNITKYSGYISGDDCTEIDREIAGFFGGRYQKAGDGIMDSLVEIRRNALAELKEAAYALGCNAVIGVDFDYITLEPETATFDGKTKYLPYILGVTANGNAVVIEKSI